MGKSVRVGVVGARGAVGSEFFRLFSMRGWEMAEVRAFGSQRSLGTVLSTPFGELPVNLPVNGAFSGLDIVFFSAGSGVSREFAPLAVEEGAIVVDNSSAFRMDPDVPLVVPEVNGDILTPERRLIANPNCSAAIMLMAVAPLRHFGRLKRIVVSTYQSASGAGWAAMEELRNQTRDVLDGKEPNPQVLPHPYAFNLFSHNTPIAENGYNDEENKIILESRKILDDPNIEINPTCVRVPVLRAHSESINIEFDCPAPPEDAVRAVLASAPGVKIVDDREANVFPMPLDASGIDDVLVGRIRRDITNPNAINLFVSGDQLLKGAALNAVQIGELVLGITPRLQS
ncbi:aspartate-semialdehyde dehydrogenase [Kamptonema cortianum]|nr:aspartate-semialdehyde dehydrogenase [Kamptonema cortianum]